MDDLKIAIGIISSTMVFFFAGMIIGRMVVFEKIGNILVVEYQGNVRIVGRAIQIKKKIEIWDGLERIEPKESNKKEE